MQSLESGIIFHKFNKQMHTQKLKKKKKRPWKQFSKFYNIFFLLKNCEKILIKGSHPHYKRIHQEPGKQN